ncbi:hypothetical protein GYRE_00738 [Yokenella regensburgei ATCC 49455]|uniref:DUF2116 family Zn-ribbon domain-containing protein n=2 Tax=Yokenella regensburgei TaxID=158877 RepID=A0AB38FWC3_9ENTR|nr:hypothetical protein GYRE_00738 [Yokenella regensburgei ATCC 49455]SQA63017.1 Uncharacterised protein [Yokenella regensburgei]SQB02260.1 Uncharacterised protein [Yokenella regensburgei]SUQ07439.1 Uncharacterised protein [Yokenella regensburgei]
MDIVDMAQEAELARMTRLLRRRLRPALAFTGACHNCSEQLKEGCFCDADCRDDHERRFRARIINGIRGREAHDGGLG